MSATTEQDYRAAIKQCDAAVNEIMASYRRDNRAQYASIFFAGVVSGAVGAFVFAALLFL